MPDLDLNHLASAAKASTWAAKLTAARLKAVLGLSLSPEDIILEAQRRRAMAGA